MEVWQTTTSSTCQLPRPLYTFVHCSQKKPFGSCISVGDDCIIIIDHGVAHYFGTALGATYKRPHLYIVAFQVHPALVKCSCVIRFYVHDGPLVHLSVSSRISPPFERTKGFKDGVLSAPLRRVLLETPPPWHATIYFLQFC